MTEPNVLGNVSPAKFLFDSGNTQIINLWKPNESTATESGHFPDDGTLNGEDYIVPVGKSFYLLAFYVPVAPSDIKLHIQSNTSPDTATSGTTLMRFRIEAQDPDRLNQVQETCCLKFDAGDYITVYDSGGNQYWWNAWGVECDA